MVKNTMLAVVAGLLLSGCVAAPRTRLIDTKTIHDAHAGRIWIIQDANEDQSVVFCDVEMLKQTRTLCVRANITQAPAPSWAPAAPPPLMPPQGQAAPPARTVATK